MIEIIYKHYYTKVDANWKPFPQMIILMVKHPREDSVLVYNWEVLLHCGWEDTDEHSRPHGKERALLKSVWPCGRKCVAMGVGSEASSAQAVSGVARSCLYSPADEDVALSRPLAFLLAPVPKGFSITLPGRTMGFTIQPRRSGIIQEHSAQC